jgi:hypothetical protein
MGDACLVTGGKGLEHDAVHGLERCELNYRMRRTGPSSAAGRVRLFAHQAPTFLSSDGWLHGSLTFAKRDSRKVQDGALADIGEAIGEACGEAMRRDGCYRAMSVMLQDDTTPRGVRGHANQSPLLGCPPAVVRSALEARGKQSPASHPPGCGDDDEDGASSIQHFATRRCGEDLTRSEEGMPLMPASNVAQGLWSHFLTEDRSEKNNRASRAINRAHDDGVEEVVVTVAPGEKRPTSARPAD